MELNKFNCLYTTFSVGLPICFNLPEWYWGFTLQDPQIKVEEKSTPTKAQIRTQKYSLITKFKYTKTGKMLDEFKYFPVKIISDFKENTNKQMNELRISYWDLERKLAL